MTTGALLERANPYLTAAARSVARAYSWLRRFRMQLAWLGSLALASGVVALIAYLFSAPDTAPARVTAWVVGAFVSVFAAILALGILALAGAFILIGSGIPPSKWDLKGRIHTVREYLAR